MDERVHQEDTMKRNNLENQEMEIISYNQTVTETKEFVSIPRGVYLSRTHQRSGRKKHAHTCIEMAYILSGSAMHSIQHKNGELQEDALTVGNYFILDYDASHMIYNTSKDFFLINFLFQPSFVHPALGKYEPFSNLLKKIFQDVHLETLYEPVTNRIYFDEDKSIRSIFDKAWETYSLKDPGYRDLLRCYISEIVIRTTKKVLPKSAGKDHAIVDIRDYVNAHYMKNISLKQICKDRYLNMSYISRKFKEVIGVSFEVYLQNVRIQNACMLLIDTNDSVDSIIEKVGYTDGDSFRRNFKRILNTTPLKFRKLYR